MPTAPWYTRGRKLIAYLTMPPVLVGGIVALKYAGASDEVVLAFQDYVFYGMLAFVGGNVLSKPDFLGFLKRTPSGQ